MKKKKSKKMKGHFKIINSGKSEMLTVSRNLRKSKDLISKVLSKAHS